MAAVPRNRLLVGDALDRLRRLPDSSVDMAFTSPPYFRLRDYGADGQVGLESHVDEWIDRLVEISAEVHRVLVPTGTYWLNVGDTYATHQSQGAARKSLLMAPERLALRLQQSGWIVRNKLIWAKPNPIPTSVKDRLNCSYEFVYVLTKQPCYFFDLDAIREPHLTKAAKPRIANKRGREAWRGPNGDTVAGLDVVKAQGRVGNPLGKNPSDVWRIAPSPVPGHHATFPLRLATRVIQAGCPEARCTVCRLPWRREVIRSLGGTAVRAALAPTCDCGGSSEAGLVLDPFLGSGTTAVAAELLGRDWVGTELNPDFAALARTRITEARQRRRSIPGQASHGSSPPTYTLHREEAA